MVAPTIEDLRRKLREKFPQAHEVRVLEEGQVRSERPFDPMFFPSGAISEVLGPGGALMLAGLLGEPEACVALPDFVLIDAGDGFDPGSFSVAACSRLFWVRCLTVEQMLRAAELLVRDGNSSFVLLDSRGVARADLQALPASAWWRLKLATELAGCRVVVMSDVPQVPCAALRISLAARLDLADFELPRRELVQRMRVVLERGRRSA